MLWVQFLFDGIQCILLVVGFCDFFISVVDLCYVVLDVVDQWLVGICDVKLYQQFDGVVFEFVLMLLLGECICLYVDLDMQVVDVMSYCILLVDLVVFYDGCELLVLGYIYWEYWQVIEVEEMLF